MSKEFKTHESLSDALDRVDRVNQYYLLDSLSCVLHNAWASTVGNTAENDVEWFADLISRQLDERPIDRAGKECQEYYRRVAKAAIESMPRLQERMAHRLLLLRDHIKDFQKMQEAKGKIERAKY